jgi:hypothetical protein
MPEPAVNKPRKPPKPRKAPEPSPGKMTFAEKCRRYPLFAAWAIPMLLFCFVPLIVWIAALVVPLPPFVPSTALKDFALISAVPIALLAFGPFVLRAPWIPESEQPRTLWKKMGRIGVIMFSPFLFAFIWIFFLHRPASLLLHTLAPKQQQTVVERFAKTGSSGVHSPICPRGLWEAVIDDSFWWPRIVCDISYDRKGEYRDGGTIALQGNVSRFGITYSSYSFGADTGAR